MPDKNNVQNSMNLIHNLTLEHRKTLNITGIKDVDSFNEEYIVVKLCDNDLIVRGTGLHITKICIESGELIVEGKIQSLTYAENKQTSGFFSKIFR